MPEDVFKSQPGALPYGYVVAASGGLEAMLRMAAVQGRAKFWLVVSLIPFAVSRLCRERRATLERIAVHRRSFIPKARSPLE